jgi:hypothetical protein
MGFITTAQNEISFPAKNTVYVELFGAGGFGSINYERMLFGDKNFSFISRMGFSTYHLTDFTNKFKPDIILPFSFIGNFGRKYRAEFGSGITYTSIVQADLFNYKPSRKNRIHSNFTVGYRFQKYEGKMFYRIAYTPFLLDFKKYIHWGGMSVGYAF